MLKGARAILNLNGSDEFKGRLIGLDTIAQEVEREGGYVAVIGKQGPTSVFDNRVATIVDGKDIVGEPHKDYLFASEDLVAPRRESKDKFRDSARFENHGGRRAARSVLRAAGRRGRVAGRQARRGCGPACAGRLLAA